MSYADVPPNVRSLEQRIRNLEGSEGLDVLPALEEAVEWVNGFVRHIAAAGS